MKTVSNLKTYDEGKMTGQVSLIKKTFGGFAKGIAKGAGLAGAINTAFPNLVPVISSMLIGGSSMSGWAKAGFAIGLASNPVAQISGWGVLAIGAAAGAVLGGTISLIKAARYNHMHKNDEAAKTR